MLKVLFLDRDGIINVDKGYLYKQEDVEFVDGIIELLTLAKKCGYKLIVVTNQAGIARGLYSHDDVKKLHLFMSGELSEKGIDILDFFYCPHHPEFTGECECRKPQPGMLFQAIEKYDIDLTNSIMIGDKRSDVQSGRNAGVDKCILLSSKYASNPVPEADLFAKDLLEVKEFLKGYCEASS